MQVWDDAARCLGLEKDKVLKLERSHLGHYFRLSKKEETAVRKKLQASFSVLEARKDGTKFTNAPLKRLSERRAEADQAYEQQQRQLVERVVEVASSFAEVFLEVSAVLAHLDVLTGFAELSSNAPAPFVRPVMRPKEDGTVSLQRCRHPCVEAQDNVTFIPNDCSLQKGAGRFHIITGPNMGGKSTFIRQVRGSSF
jgi:DNA mismatch repair protein MSH2